jgi:hypothetical protein
MRLIDLDELLNFENEYANYIKLHENDTFKAGIDEVLSYAKGRQITETPLDTAPVVRCKNCKYRVKSDNKYPRKNKYQCKIWTNNGAWDNDFCSYGVRRQKNAKAD